MTKFDELYEAMMTRDLIPHRNVRVGDIELPKEVTDYLKNTKFKEVTKKVIIPTFRQDINNTFDDTMVTRIDIELLPLWATKLRYDAEKKDDTVVFKIIFTIKNEIGESYRQVYSASASPKDFGKKVHKFIDKEI